MFICLQLAIATLVLQMAELSSGSLRASGPQFMKYLLSGPLQKMFANSWSFLFFPLKLF